VLVRRLPRRAGLRAGARFFVFVLVCFILLLFNILYPNCLTPQTQTKNTQTQPPDGPPPGAKGCRVGAASCWDLLLILSYCGLALGAGAAFTYQKRLRELTEREARLFGARTVCFFGGEGLCVERCVDLLA
jgi:hypothetical protein